MLHGHCHRHPSWTTLFVCVAMTTSTCVPSSALSLSKSATHTSTSSATTISGSDRPPQEPYGMADIDYSAANEYLDEQYEEQIANPYFPENQKEEPVYNGRLGIWNDENQRLEEPSLESCGFELQSRHLEAPNVQDWTNKRQLRDHYVPVLRDFFEQRYGSENIRHLLFYNPMARGEELPAQRTDLDTHELPSSPTQTMAHMDNDWYASNLDRVVGLVEKQTLDHFDDPQQFPRNELMQDIQEGYRYMVVNCWRNAGTKPIQRAPLGLYATRYSNSNNKVFPETQPDFSRSRWYVFPEMTREECLLFKQYDRDDRYMSDVWHCALHSLHRLNQDQKDDDPPPRTSFDVRAFVVLQDQVPNKHDRYPPRDEQSLQPKYKTAQEHQADTS